MQEKFVQMWQKIAKDLEAVLADDLLQIAQYSTHTACGRLAVVLEVDSGDTIYRVAPIYKGIVAKKLPAPLIIGRSYINESLDSFPLEFLDIKSRYTNLYCEEDLLSTLKFDKKWVRLQVERELKGKWLLIRTALLENFGRTKILEELVRATYESFVPIFRGLSFLADKTTFDEPELLGQMTQILKSPLSNFNKARAIHTGQSRLEKNKQEAFFMGLLDEINKAAQFTDDLDQI